MKSLFTSIQWKAIEQCFLVVLFIMLHKVVIESQGVNSQIKTSEGNKPAVLYFQNEIWEFCPVFELVKARSNK